MGWPVIESVASLAIPGSLTVSASGGPPATRPAGVLPQFWLGPENRLVQIATDIVLEGGNPHCNPLIFHGPSGSGKSHLAFGLVAVWRKRHRNRPALYCTAIDFARELTDAVEANAVEDFRDRYRSASLVAIDDVDRLDAKQSAQRELIHTFDALVEAGARMLLTSTRPPEELGGLLPSLVSRLVSGLSVGLAIPAAPTRHVLLERLAETRGVALDAPLAALLAEGLPLPVPHLVGALLELDLAVRVDGGSITAEQVRSYLAARSGSPRPTLRDIANHTARALFAQAL